MSEYGRLTVTPQPAAPTANPDQVAGPPLPSAAFAVQRVITNLLHLQPLRKVKSILSRPFVGTASDPQHPMSRGPLLKNTLLSCSNLLVPARNKPKCFPKKR